MRRPCTRFLFLSAVKLIRFRVGKCRMTSCTLSLGEWSATCTCTRGLIVDLIQLVALRSSHGCVVMNSLSCSLIVVMESPLPSLSCTACVGAMTLWVSLASVGAHFARLHFPPFWIELVSPCSFFSYERVLRCLVVGAVGYGCSGRHSARQLRRRQGAHDKGARTLYAVSTFSRSFRNQCA